MKHFKIISILLLVSLFVGCASLNSVSMTPVPKERSKVVKASSSSYSFLGIQFSNDFAQEVREELEKQCPGGKVTGIFTTFESFLYLIILEREVKATGFCVEG